MGAYEATYYTLTVNIVGNGTVTLDPDEQPYTEGTVVTLNATAAEGWSFANWSGDLTDSTSPATITMDGNKSVTATFTEVTISGGARTTKGEAVDVLGGVDTGNRRVDRVIGRVIRYINKSLREKYWEDDSQLVPKYGRKVFFYERIAVGKAEFYSKFWERRGPTPEQEQAIEAFEEVIPELVNADKSLAKTALDEANGTSPPDNNKKSKLYEWSLAKANKYYEKALSYMDKDRPSWAIKYFGRSWQYSQRAISLARQG